jgi:hypothetical protein
VAWIINRPKGNHLHKRENFSPHAGRKLTPLYDPGNETRTLFLHVFEITSETNLAPAELTVAAPVGVDIGAR